MLTTVGLQKVLDALVNNAALGDLTLKLYKTNVTPSATSVAGDFTESTFSGYSAKTLTEATWGASSAASGIASITYDEQTWTASGGGESVYGWYLVNGAGTLIAAHKLSSAITVTSGTVLKHTPKISAEQPA